MNIFRYVCLLLLIFSSSMLSAQEVRDAPGKKNTIIATNSGTGKSITVEVYGSQYLDPDAIVKMTGLDMDPTLSVEEVRRRLETSSLFSTLNVNRVDENTMRIFARMKKNWFILPYFSSNGSTIYGIAFGQSAFYGQDAEIVGKLQNGSQNREAAILLRDYSFQNSPWMLGTSLDYEDSNLQEYRDREIFKRTYNWYLGGSLRAGYRFTPYFSLTLLNYIERHRFKDLQDQHRAGLQLSHKWVGEYSRLFVNEGITRGWRLISYFEHNNPASDFDYMRFGLLGDVSVLLRGDFNWITYARAERGYRLPRYLQYEIGGANLRGFPGEMFRTPHYYLVQNDFLLSSWNVWKLKLRPLAFADWAYVNQGGRTGIGAGLRIFFKSVAVPAIQVFGGYGFNPNGFSVMASIGPQM